VMIWEHKNLLLKLVSQRNRVVEDS
jgi:hypothetical protein